MLIIKHRRIMVALADLHLCLSLAGGQAPAAEVTPAGLRCENSVNPLGIGATNPRLSWELRAGDATALGLKQTAYQLLAASSSQLLAEWKADFWDIRPMPVAALGSVSAWHDSPYGRLSSRWELKGSNKGTVFTLEAGIPANTTATIQVLSADGEVKVNGKPLERILGLKLVSKGENEVVVKVGSGDYRFETLWTASKI